MKLTSVRSQDQRRMLQANSHTFPTNAWIHKITLFMLYIIYFAVEVSLPHMSSGHREGGPRTSIALGRHMRCSVSTTRRPSPRIEYGEGVVSPRSVTDSTDQWV